ncbi:MAG TPA: DUF2252 domain-containing protein [Acidimicrobiales bacterium]|nr:DUF2252 domain-containing protein [Acidimicrobiales bacterium]
MPSGAHDPVTRSELRAAGRALRKTVPRRSHSQWRQPADRPDPLEVLARTNEGRLPELVPVRQQRMMESPFSYYRGAPAMMAADLARTPATGVTLQICGDAHLLNFGMFATPERNLVFDLNDFDETQPGSWEWDLKRLAASLVIAARTAGLTDADGRAAVLACSAEYRSQMEAMSQLSAFDVWHARLDAAALLAEAPDRRSRSAVERGVSNAMQRTSLQALAKLTTVRGGRRVIVADPPLVIRLTDEQLEQAHRSLGAYVATLEADRRVLLDHYELVDAALKVVGVGSVGTRCFIALLAGRADLDPLFLQMKEARTSVLAPHVGRSRYSNQGRRVVVGQRIMQAASDTFLGWARMEGFDFYVRQLRDMKLSVRLDSVRPGELAAYGRLCGATLARAHARAGRPALLAGYLGSSPAFDEALAAFAVTYADQNERDFEAFLSAARGGRLPSPSVSD